MKLVTCLAAILALASSDPIYTSQPTEHFVNNAEAYQSALEHQQQGVYGDQSQYSHQDFSQSEAGYSQGQTVAFPSGQTSFAGQSAYAGQNAYQQQRPSTEKTARIVSFQNENKGNSYQYSYETENGIKVQERGEAQGKGIRAQGGYSYTGDDGKVYTVTYTADENGFHPQGAHLPTPPPIPEAIQKSIELNARQAANGVYDDGSYKEENELIRQSQQHQIQVQQVHQIPEIQQVHQIAEIQQVHHVPEIQEVHHAPEIQQVQQVQHGQEVYENPAYQQEYQQQEYHQQQEYQQEVTATTAGYHYQ